MTTVPVTIPYNLEPHQLTVDPTTVNTELQRPMEYITSHISWADNDGTLERIMRAAIVLHEHSKSPFGECLETAIIWEMG